MTDKSIIEKVGTLNSQEAKVVKLMRELPYQKLVIHMENGKVVNKKQNRSIKD